MNIRGRKNRVKLGAEFLAEMENKYFLFAENETEGGGGAAGGDAAAVATGEADAAGDDAQVDSAVGKEAAVNSLLANAGKSEIVDKAEKINLLAGKFKNPEELEAGYKELTKKLTESGKIAPDKYEVALPEGLELADAENDPQLKSFEEIARKHNLTNAAYNELIALKLQADYAAMPNPEAEMKLLGANGMETLRGLSAFLEKNFDADEYKLASEIASTAAGVRFLDKYRGLTRSTNVPAGAERGGETVTHAQAEEALAKAMKAESDNAPEAVRLRAEATRLFNTLYPS